MKPPEQFIPQSTSEVSSSLVVVACVLSVIATSVASGILLWVAQPYPAVWPRLAVIYGLYAALMALLFGLPAFLLLRRRAIAPWLLVPTAALGAAGPLAALLLLTTSKHTLMAWWPVPLEAVAGAIGGLAYWALTAPDAYLRRRLVATVWSVLGFLAVGTSSWYLAWHVDDFRYAPWEDAASAECPLMARAMSRTAIDERLPRLPPLYARSRFGGPCDWRGLGINLTQGVQSDLYLSSDGAGQLSGRFTPHLILGRPIYSFARLRASVPVTYRFGDLGGHIYACHFHRSLSGWALEGCSLDRMI